MRRLRTLAAVVSVWAPLGCGVPGGEALDGGAAWDAGSSDREAGSNDADAGDDAGASDIDGGANDADAGADAGANDADAGADAGANDAGLRTTVGTWRVWVWNVAGHLLHGGSTTDGLVEAAVSSIRARDADLVGFNELCFSQYRALQSGLRAAGWPADPANFSRFSETRAPRAEVCAGTAFGNAIFSRRPLGAVDDVTLPSDGSVEHRSLLCAPLLAQPHLRFCATHITTSNEVGPDGFAANVRQLRAVLTQLEAYHARGDTVLIGGDFNAQPSYARLDRFYAPSLATPVNDNNLGRYRELDDDDTAQCLGYGESTTEGSSVDPCGRAGVKIDLLFVRESALAGPYEADSLAISDGCGGPCSDHRILVGSAMVSVRE